MRDFIPALIALFILAIVARDDTVLTLFYLMAAVYFVGRWWSRRALRAVHYKRNFTAHAFPNETVPVRLVLTNSGLLPVVWVSLHESLPSEISAALNVREVASLGPHGRRHIEYTLRTYKRGYYPVGPLFLGSGDLFGLHDDTGVQGDPDHLTVYPRVVPLTRLGLPSRSPLGTLRHTQPIFEDPTRVSGKRPYQVGDSLRRVDWRATAASGQLQVKLFEPSIALETMIFLDLHTAAYDLRYRFDATELAVVVAASLASWVVSQKQPVGLVSNGLDPLGVSAMPARKGRAHLIRILETLARIQMSESGLPLGDLLRRQAVSLPWGTTLIVVSGRSDEALFDSLFRARRAGLNIVLIFTVPLADFNQVRQRGEHFGFKVYQITRERDLDRWRR
jgi:uncharacterized protein (DUF58 family)